MLEAGPMVFHAAALQKSPRSVRRLKAEGINDLLAELKARGYIVDRGTGVWEVRDVQS